LIEHSIAAGFSPAGGQAIPQAIDVILNFLAVSTACFLLNDLLIFKYPKPLSYRLRFHQQGINPLPMQSMKQQSLLPGHPKIKSLSIK